MIENRAAIDQVFASLEGSDWIHIARDMLSQLSVDDVVEMLSCVEADPTWFQDVLQNSYTHDNGFEKIVLGTSPNSTMKLRLHVWHMDAPGSPIPRGDQNFHNHRWSFVSRILCGGFQFSTYNPVSVELNNPRHRNLDVIEYEYCSPEGGTQYVIKRVGPAGLDKRMDLRLPTGTVYHIEHDVVHHVADPNLPYTVTLLVQGPLEKNSTRVFANNDLAHGEEVGVKSMDSNRLLSILKGAASTLQGLE